MTDSNHRRIITVERLIKDQFARHFDIGKIIADQIPVNRTDKATVFLTDKKQLFVFIEAQSQQTLGNVRKIISRMGLVPQQYLPPHGDADYFDSIGREKFKLTFPGRSRISSEDLRYYRTLAVYNPAIVQIAETKTDTIYCFDSDTRGGWRAAVKFAYRRIPMSR